MRGEVRSTFRPGVMTDIGGFGGFFDLSTSGLQEPVLVSGTDGVGTKIRVAIMMDRHDSIGIDLVAMCVNDILVHGAQPLFFLDYLALGKLHPPKVAAIVKGIAQGCRDAGCALIGGETAEMPGFYGEDEYDLAGFAVGAVEKADIISGSEIKAGDLLVGLPSSGLHSNGYSLARKVFFEAAGYQTNTYLEALGKTVGEEMLQPTRIYAQAVRPVLEKYKVKGMAHITGGGLLENPPRILPPELGVVLQKRAWPVPPVFQQIQEIGAVEESEMFRTFNMGIGFVLVVREADAEQIIKALNLAGEPAYLIGAVMAGEAKVRLEE